VGKKDYEEFILWLRKDPAGYVAIPSGPAPVGTGPGDPFSSPFRDGELEEMRAFQGSRQRELDSPEEMTRRRVSDLGERLFEAVFAGKVRRFWDTSLDRARHSGRGLRLRLILESPELWDWPWEYLRDPDSDFLIFSPDISIVRCPEVPQAVPTFRGHLPLRIVVVVAQPRGTMALDSEREWQELKRNLAPLEASGRVELSRVAPASLATLRKELGKPIHVLHFIGHGGLDRNRQQGVLQFEKRDGEPDPVTGRELARFLRRQSPPALVVLNACEGGRAVQAHPFAGVAQALVKEGVPAVVAMQFRVSDQAAIVFSNSFYEALAAGEPVDHAVYEARHALFAERSERFGVDWGNPVLYLRSSQGKIFDFSAARLRTSRRRIVAGASALLLGAFCTGGYLLLRDGWSPPASSPGSVEGCPPLQELGIVFKRINPGTFMMGSRGAGKDAKPHQVTLTKPFCMSEHEITQGQWETIMRENPSKHQGNPQLPVETVSWNRVQEFLAKLLVLDRKANFRLPTEAQWEYAARAGSTTRFSFGDDPRQLVQYGNCESLGVDDHHDGTAPTGSFASNDWGLYDMQGNVSEWVADWYAPYSLAPQTDPLGPLPGTEKVRRGGSFDIIPEHCALAQRNKMKPDNPKDDVGFRIIRDVEE
jgi:hypothetical protein